MSLSASIYLLMCVIDIRVSVYICEYVGTHILICECMYPYYHIYMTSLRCQMSLS